MGIWFIFPWEILIEILRPRWDGQPLSRSAVGATGGKARTRCREGRGGFGWGGAAAKAGEARGAEAPQAAGGGRGELGREGTRDEARSVGKTLGTRRARSGRRRGRAARSVRKAVQRRKLLRVAGHEQPVTPNSPFPPGIAGFPSQTGSLVSFSTAESGALML